MREISSRLSAWPFDTQPATVTLELARGQRAPAATGSDALRAYRLLGGLGEGQRGRPRTKPAVMQGQAGTLYTRNRS